MIINADLHIHSYFSRNTSNRKKIESYDSIEASVWVKIPNLPSGSSKMYLFYSRY